LNNLASSNSYVQTVNQASQTISFASSAPAATVGGSTYTPTATGGGSGNPVTFAIDASSTPGACSISGGVVSFTGAGSCIIDANQAGNTNYSPAPQVQQTVTVGTGSQTISFTSSAPSATVGGPTYTPTATSTSGLTVALTIDATSSGICSISGGVVSFTAVGSCIIDANQAGDANYSAAAQVQQVVTVGQGLSTTALSSSKNPSAFGESVTFTATVTGSSPTGTVAFFDGAHRSAPQRCPARRRHSRRRRSA
jgi:hypothetical protein